MVKPLTRANTVIVSHQRQSFGTGMAGIHQRRHSRPSTQENPAGC